MAEHVCPVWIGYLLASPIRKLLQNPRRILQPFVNENMIVMDVGCAMGFFSIPMAEMVKPNGRVICLDLQDKMIEVLKKKADKAGLSQYIQTIGSSSESLNLDSFKSVIDFALAFAVLHEVPDQSRFLNEINLALKPKGRLLLSEPKGHVTEIEFEKSLEIGRRNKFDVIARPKINGGLSAVLEKTN